MSLKVAVLANHAADLQSLSADLPLSQHALQISAIAGDVPQLVGELLKLRPDLAVVQVEQLDGRDFGLFEAAIRNLPATSLIMLTPDQRSEFLMRAMRAGVREVVKLPLTNGELKDAFARQLERMHALQSGAQTGKTLAFLPAKGGAGASFLATNVAFSLAQRAKRVAVIDMNLQFGDAILYLTDQRPNATLADVCKQIDRLDAELLNASMTSITDRLWVLPAPDSPERALEVKPDGVERIIALARTQFDFVVLDMGRVVEAISIKALDAADAIYMVMQYNVQSIHDAKRLMNLMLTLGYPREKVHVVANRYKKGGEISSDDVRKALDAAIAVQVPNSYENVAYSANHGLPIAKHAPRDPVAKAIDDMASVLAPSSQRRSGWLGGIRRGH